MNRLYLRITAATLGLIIGLLISWAMLWFPMNIERVIGKYWCDSGNYGISLDIRKDGTFTEYDGNKILRTGNWSLETGTEPTLNLSRAYPLEDPHIQGWKEGGAVSYLLAMRHWRTCIQVNEDLDEVHWCRGR